MSSAARPDPLAPGSRIGGYEVIEVQSVVGPVQTALVSDDRGDRFRLQVLGVQRPGLFEQLAQESRLQKRTEHPAFAPILDVVDAGGRVGVVREAGAGRTLRDRMNEAGAMDLDEALDLFEQLVAGVCTAHRTGALHGDLRPEHVHLDGGRVRVDGFGVALHLGADGRRGAGVPLGHLAPELHRGGARVDERSDVFAMGVMLYELLSGQAPFQGGPASILAAVSAGRFAPLDQVRSRCPSRLVDLVHACLAADPGRRPSDCEVVAGLLSEVPRRRIDGAVQVSEPVNGFKDRVTWSPEDTRERDVVVHTHDIVPHGGRTHGGPSLFSGAQPAVKADDPLAAIRARSRESLTLKQKAARAAHEVKTTPRGRFMAAMVGAVIAVGAYATYVVALG